MKIIYWLVATIVSLLLTFTASAATIALNQQTSTVTTGDTFTLELIGQDFTDATVGGGVDVLFNASILQVVGVTFGTSDFDFTNTVNSIDNSTATGGKIDSILVSSVLSTPVATFNIARIEFVAVGIGTSTLDLEPSTFSAPWLTSLGADIDPNFLDGSVTVSAVPLPPAFWLILSSLGFLGMISKR